MNYDDSFLRRQYLINLFPIMFSILGGTINALIDSVFISLVLGKDGRVRGEVYGGVTWTSWGLSRCCAKS